MIDFSKAGIIKLKPINNDECSKTVHHILVEDEVIVRTFKTVRDNLVFTNKRIIGINIQGLVGKKRDITSLPLNNIQAFSVESSGTFETTSQMELWFAGLGKIRFEFDAKVDVYQLAHIIGSRMLR